MPPAMTEALSQARLRSARQSGLRLPPTCDASPADRATAATRVIPLCKPERASEKFVARIYLRRPGRRAGTHTPQPYRQDTAHGSLLSQRRLVDAFLLKR